MSLSFSTPPYTWQNNKWQAFVKDVDMDRVPHAYLLIGPDGVGIGQFAFAMARYLLCLAPLDGAVCNRCRACQLLSANSHGDVLFIGPEEKATQIKVDQIRAVTEFVSKTPLLGDRKLVIIEPADKMNINAANALLKNLEEPPGQTVFILVCSEPHKLLPTIKSRCRIMEHSIPTSPDSIAYLKALGYDNVTDWLQQAGGAPLVVEHWLKNGIDEERNQITKGLVELSLGSVQPIGLAKKWNKLDSDLVVQVMLSMVETLIYHYVAKKTCLPPYVSVSRKLSRAPIANLFRYRARLCEKRAQLAGPYNLNAGFVIEALLMDWHAIANGGDFH